MPFQLQKVTMLVISMNLASYDIIHFIIELFLYIESVTQHQYLLALGF